MGHEGRSFRILGALGEGTFAPLLAEEQWAGRTRKVVLGRPAPDAAAALSGCLSERVLPELGRVRLDGREFGVFGYAPGRDLAQIADGGGLSDDAIATVREEVLAALEAAPVGHGAITGASVRVTPAGVRLVGFTGRDADDRRMLDELLVEVRGSPGRSLSDVASAEDVLVAHPWSGLTLAEDRQAQGRPPRVHTAAFAGVTLVLGLLAGKMLFGN